MPLLAKLKKEEADLAGKQSKERAAAAASRHLFNALNDQRPHIMHFSGHGSPTGLFFDGTDTVGPDGVDVDFGILTRLLKGTDQPPTLLALNACESYEGAETLLDAVPVVVAKAFAIKFYAAIASGQSLASALTQAQAAIDFLTGEGSTPEVLARPGIELQDLVLVTALPA